MSFGDWYDFTKWAYGDKENVTDKMIATKAHEWWLSCRYSIERGSATSSMKILVQQLFDEHTEEAAAWMTRLIMAIGNISVAGFAVKKGDGK